MQISTFSNYGFPCSAQIILLQELSNVRSETTWDFKLKVTFGLPVVIKLLMKIGYRIKFFTFTRVLHTVCYDFDQTVTALVTPLSSHAE